MKKTLNNNLYGKITISGTPQPCCICGRAPCVCLPILNVATPTNTNKQPCSFCGVAPCVCTPITATPVSTINNQAIPTVHTGLHKLRNGQFAKGVLLPNGQKAYTPLQNNNKAIPLPFKGNSFLQPGVVYAPYIPIYNTFSGATITARQYTVTLPVTIFTEEIQDYSKRFPNGLLITEWVYKEIINQLNASSPKKQTVSLSKLIQRCHEPLVCIGHRWEVPSIYTTLWACQGHGPLLLDNNDRLRFDMVVQLVDDTGTGRDMQPMIDVLNADYLSFGDNSNFLIKLHGKFKITKEHLIVGLTPERLSWLENGCVIA